MQPPETFHGGAAGLCLIRNDEILCEAYAPWWAEGVCEIGVITPERHHRQGYARITCTYLAREIEDLGLTTTWTCHKATAGSVAVARSIGYRSELPYELVEYDPL